MKLELSTSCQQTGVVTADLKAAELRTASAVEEHKRLAETQRAFIAMFMESQHQRAVNLRAVKKALKALAVNGTQLETANKELHLAQQKGQHA